MNGSSVLELEWDDSNCAMFTDFPLQVLVAYLVVCEDGGEGLRSGPDDRFRDK